jgi:hypothetical protein
MPIFYFIIIGLGTAGSANLTIGPPDSSNDTSLQKFAHPPHRAVGLKVGEERNAAMALLATTLGLLPMVEEEKCEA